ncbi:MAG: imidazole glycerol phosphate synthase subunit HisH [Pseudomonadota bacterium]|nr:imidazole glycerol phosphate synthase subunit HisH [Pseudomonadota bacterium]MDQ3229222.1 imidazole glycerol phosphate synthase subunit HisH [Pseudomonadota bacterium]
MSGAAANAVVLVDAGGANIGSVRHALQRLGVDAPLTGDADLIRNAGRVILPGVGAAGAAMARLQELGLVDTIRDLRQPLLGICVGMQILFESSDEGPTECLGLLPGKVGKLAGDAGLRVPHMGWNRLAHRVHSPLLDGIGDGAHAYFVHGYAAPCSDPCITQSHHGAAFAAVVQQGNIAGVQFHPERSAATGARFLRNFLEWTPA